VTNIQLVSVAERTQEIGIRAAIGASPRQIMRQFLLEALVLSSLGAAGGVALGLAVASLVSRWMTWAGVVSPAGVAGVALFGISVGLVFGYLPARRAAQLDPVEALRHE
jgi:putative ABC transport system permease protein